MNTHLILLGIFSYMLLGFLIDFSRFFSWWKKDREIPLITAVKKYFEYFCVEHLLYWAFAPVETVYNLFLKLISRGK